MNFPVCLDIAHYEDKSKQKILYNQEKREKKFWSVRVTEFPWYHLYIETDEQVNERVADASLIEMLRIAM